MAGIEKLYCVVLFSSIFGLASCASTEELFAEYDNEFCPAPQHLVKTKTVEKEVFRDRVVVREIAAKGNVMPWVPAVYFASDSAGLSLSARQVLRANVEFLRQFADFYLSIRGFTDQHGSADYNQKLSLKRVTNVRQFYQENGISAARIVVNSHGESLAAGDGSSPLQDEIGRRVEMVLLDSTGRPVVRLQPVARVTAE